MMLTAENYFSTEANREFMSVSQFKAFEKCEFSAMAELNGTYQREPTSALLVGSYVDAHFDRTLGVFKAKHPELFKRDGSLKSEYIKAEEVIQRIESDEMMVKYLSGEKQVIMTCEIAGVPFKCKMDSYHPGKAIVDLKVMRDFEHQFKPGEGRLNFIEFWRYDLQGAIYQEAVYQQTGKRLPFFIVAATKETVPDIGIFQITQDYLDTQLEIVKANAPRYQAIKEGLFDPIRCEKCDACKATKKINRIMTMEELDDD